jgi:N-methylhydantoinase A
MAVLPGRPLFKSEVAVARHPIRTHTIDIETIGAGGGSIASVQLGGVLKVGPQSAGAVPGPACYNRGGTEPTLTDALVLLGHLNPDTLLSGAMAISSDKAREAVVTRVAEPLNLPPSEAAWGILRVLSTNVMVAMRSITVERGYDPREFTLVPFGGIGPTIAGLIAAELGIGRILVPRDPGAFSAYGMLVTDVQQSRSITRITALDQTNPAALDEIFAGIAATARDDLIREGFTQDRLMIRRSAGMRYRGQSYEVSVPVEGLRTADDLTELQQRFHAAHHRRYGHMAQAEAVEIVNFSVTAIGLIPKPEPKTFEMRSTRTPPPSSMRRAYFNATEAKDVPVFQRDTLHAGAQIDGPAIIEETTSTTVIYPGQRASIDHYLNIEIAFDALKAG